MIRPGKDADGSTKMAHVPNDTESLFDLDIKLNQPPAFVQIAAGEGAIRTKRRIVNTARYQN